MFLLMIFFTFGISSLSLYNYADDNTLSYARSNSDTLIHTLQQAYFYITVDQYRPDEG